MTPNELTRLEMRALYDHLCRTGTEPAIAAIRDKVQRRILEMAANPEAGAKVFELVLTLDLAPTLNRYGSMEGWMQKKTRDIVDLKVLEALGKWRGAVLTTARRRFARVTRFSSGAVDELGIDVLGGKIPIDRIVKRRILWGDTAQWLIRDARWMRASPRAGKLLVEVFEVV